MIQVTMEVKQWWEEDEEDVLVKGMAGLSLSEREQN